MGLFVSQEIDKFYLVSALTSGHCETKKNLLSIRQSNDKVYFNLCPAPNPANLFPIYLWSKMDRNIHYYSS